MPSEPQRNDLSVPTKRTIFKRPVHALSGFRALKSRNFRLFWTGQLISLTGNWMQATAQSWLVYQLTNSPFSIGLVTTLQFLPVTLLSLYGGVLADRLRKHRALLFTQSISMLQTIIFALLVATDAIQLWHIYLLAMAQGLINVLDTPTRQAFVVELVGRDDLQNAVALNSMAFNAARIVGPSAAGVIIDKIEMAPALMLNAISFIPVLAALLRMDVSALHVVPPLQRGSTTRRLLEGLSYAWHTPEVLVILIVVASIGTFGYNFSVVLPLLAGFVLDTEASGFGALSAFLGIGSLTAAVMTAFMARVSMKRLFWGAAGFSIVFSILALSRVFALSAALLVALGFSGITFTTSANTLLQLKAPDDMRGRIMSVYVLLFMGSTPIGGFLIGALSDTFGVEAALLTCAVLCLSGVLIAVLYYHRASQRETNFP